MQPNTTERLLQPVHLNTSEVASRLRVHQRTVERWRRMKVGPPFLKVMGRILYRLSDVEAYEAAQLRLKDSDQ